MNSAWTRAVIVVLSLVVIVMFVGQAFFTNKSDVVVETVYRYEFDDEISFEGVYMRDETLVYDFDPGVLSYECEDGSKVGKSSVIARRYKSDSDVVYRRQVESLKKQISVLESAEKLIGTDNSQLDAISAQINEGHSKIISSILSGDYDSAETQQNELLEAMCKREITLGNVSDYSLRKSMLNSEISRINGLISGDVVEITANGTGFFASEVDGYESDISFDSIDKMTEEYITQILDNPYKQSASGGVIGKLIQDYRWRVAAVIENENLTDVNEGSTVTLRVGSGSQLLEAEVVSVKPCGDKKAIYIFECDRLNSSVVTGRTARFKIVTDSYGGLRVPIFALRRNDNNEQGVYVVRGQSLVFKRVDVVYWGEDYVICEQNPDEGYLMMYDEVVVEGVDLYDGKVIVR